MPEPDLLARVQSFCDERFFEHHSGTIDELTLAVAEERQNTPWLLDSDVDEVYKALRATIKTLASGIYYEALPEGPVRASLFRRLKAELDRLMSPDSQPMLKVGEALQVVDFLTFAFTMNSNTRPRSRQYLDWVSSMAGAGEPAEARRLILP